MRRGLIVSVLLSFLSIFSIAQVGRQPGASRPAPRWPDGRVRLSSQSNLRIELIRNFYWNFQLYENYDTRPPIAAPKNDLGITTSVGWTF